LAAAGASLAARAVQLIGSSHVHATPQDEAHATLARKLTKEDGRIDWKQPARAIHNRVRGFSPWPSCFASFQGAMLKVLRTSVEPASSIQHPASVLRIDGTGPLVGTGEAALRLLEVQPEGKKPMSGADWARGYRVEVGSTFNV
ncbi:MAG TPA: methionyl-tRNA formyltransferase, partial [Kiritimatiellia bacterium]